MGTAAFGERVGKRPLVTAGGLTLVAYAVVIATFAGALPYPPISRATSTLLSHAIAIVNAATVACLLAGWYWVRTGAVRRHRIAMSFAMVLILAFLGMYLLRIGGGGTKTFVGPSTIRLGYLAMLAVHILLSIAAVPLVIYVFVLGVSRTVPEIRRSPHARVGRVAASVWILSLVLGLVTYLLLEHVYASTW